MTVPNDLLFSRTHEWLRREDDGVVVVGISHYAQDQLGEVVFVELPDPGRTVGAGEELGSLESVKAVSEFYAPVTGEVVAANARLQDEPNLVNEDPYGEGWLVRVRTTGEEADLMDAAAYQSFLAEESA